MLAAVSAWGALAAELHGAAASCNSVVSDLAGIEWRGPSAMSMSAAITPYIEWMTGAAGQAEEVAMKGKAAVAAYEAAFAATVPPPVIAANRSLLAVLVATNILGQNAPAIAATEAEYAAMWAQDAAAMYGYAHAAAAATRLTPFTPPPRVTNPDGADAQLAAVSRTAGTTASRVAAQASRLAAQVPNALQGLATQGITAPAAAAAASVPDGLSRIAQAFDFVASAYTPLGLMAVPGTWWLTALQTLGLFQNTPGVISLLSGAPPITGVLGPIAGGYEAFHGLLGSVTGGGGAVGPGVVTAGIGRAASVGALSVPASWVAATPAAKTAAALMPGGALDIAPVVAAEGQQGLLSELALSSLAGRAIAGNAMGSGAAATVRVIDREADLDLDNPTTATILVIPAPEEGDSFDVSN